MKKELKITDIKFGLFKDSINKNYFKDLITYHKRKKFLYKHGYNETANWETFSYFCDMFIEILENYRDNASSFPTLLNDYDPVTATEEDYNREKEYWNKELNKMIDLLKIMNEVDNLDNRDDAIKAKDEFFILFSKYFYNLWD